MWMLIILPSFIVSTIIISTCLIYRNRLNNDNLNNDINEYIYDKDYDINKDDNNVEYKNNHKEFNNYME